MFRLARLRRFSPHPRKSALAGALGLALTFSTPALALEAACQGRDLLSDMPAAARQALDAELARTPYATGNLWQAVHADGTRITLVGTMHLADPRQAAQMATLGPLLDQSQLLIVEASPETETALLARIARTPDLAFITEGPSLLDQLGPEDWAKLKEEMAARGVPGIMAAKFQPWYALLTLSIPACIAKDIKTGGAMGLDRQLIARAIDKGIPLLALEDLDLLLSSLNHGTRDEQLASLRLTLRTQLASPDMVATMLNSYFAGRHRESWSFWRYLDLGLSPADKATVEGEVAQMESALLEGRNLDWIGKILAASKGKTTMVAVGAAHLSDWHGLLNQLKEKGFTLTRLDG